MVVKFSSEVHYSRVEQEGVIIDLRGGRMIQLNTTAAAIVEALLSEEDYESAMKILGEVLNVQDGRLVNDVESLIDQLKSLELIQDGDS